MAAPDWLLNHAANTYSQNGEDGVLAKILSLLPSSDYWCVEFGAWDGVHLSNVRRLILEERYSAILIEADPGKFTQLSKNYSGNDRVTAVNATVGFGAGDGLDRILASYPVPRDFDFLSIDIDGNDYHVWKAIETYRPKVVCVEFNPTVPTEVHFVQRPDPGIHQGASLRALNELAREKQYELVCVLSVNAFFVDRPYFAKFEIVDNSPTALRRDLSLVTWMFSGYDGSIHLEGYRKLPWHGVRLREGAMQVLPRLLRKFPDNYSSLSRFLLRVFRRFRSR